MTLEQLGLPALEVLEKMSDEEILKHFDKYLTECRITQIHPIESNSKTSTPTPTKPKKYIRVKKLTKEELLQRLIDKANENKLTY